MKWLKRKLIKWVVRDLFNGVTEEDILNVKSKNQITFKGKPLSKEQVEQLKNDAIAIQGSALWKLMSNDMKYLANKRMFETGETETDLIFGRVMLYWVDVVDTKLKNLKNL